MGKTISKIIEADCVDILRRIDIQKLKDKSVMLTGSNGFLGRYIAYTIYFANKYKGLNCKLYCLSLHEPIDDFAALDEDVNIIFLQRDLSRPFSFDYKVDYIFHTACYAQPKKFLKDKFKTLSLNVDAVRFLLEIARVNNANFMFFSSGGVYGYEYVPEEIVPIPETYSGCCLTTEPRAVYCESKRLGETICSIYQRDYNLGAYIVRIGYVYGPGISINDQRALGNFIRKALVDKEIKMLDKGSSVKIFGYISDIVYMIFKVMLEGKNFLYNVGGIDSLSIRNLAQGVADVCGNVRVIAPDKVISDDARSSNKKSGLDISRFINEFGTFEFIPFSEGIKRTVDWNIEEFELLLANKK